MGKTPQGLLHLWMQNSQLWIRCGCLEGYKMSNSQGHADVADRIKELVRPDSVLVVGLTGSVASGKTTLAENIVAHLSTRLDAAHITTDGFLFPNAVLQAQDLMNRKGFPETYDKSAMAGALTELRRGKAAFPIYDHVTYDIDPNTKRELVAPDVLVLEGLGLGPTPPTARGGGSADVLVYLDADEADIEAWFLERFLRFWRAAESDPTSFYAQWLHMSLEEITEFAGMVWRTINLPNLRDHIAPIKAMADIVVLKDRDHSVRIVEDRL